jgi:hypothetical protein
LLTYAVGGSKKLEKGVFNLMILGKYLTEN